MRDIVVVGAGFAGSILARLFAEKGRKVLIIERRSHIAGNAYDEMDKEGILIQRYGPHFFATNEWWIIKYLKRFSDFYEWSVVADSYVDGRYIERPYNFRTLKQLVGVENSQPIIEALRLEFGEKHRVTIGELMESNNSIVNNYAQLLIDKLYAPYISKQWNLGIGEIDEEVVNRSQIVLGYDKQLGELDFQYLPSEGYTKMFERILDHDNISVVLESDAIDRISFHDECNRVYFDDENVNYLFYTGAIEELFKYEYGELPYRSRYFEYEYYEQDKVLPRGVVTYPQNDIKYLRQTEYKYFNPHKDTGKTVIQTEYSVPYCRGSNVGSEPYYPILNESNNNIYFEYLNKASYYTNLYLCGRLAEYRYLDMDTVVKNAFSIFKKVYKND